MTLPLFSSCHHVNCNMSEGVLLFRVERRSSQACFYLPWALLEDDDIRGGIRSQVRLLYIRRAVKVCGQVKTTRYVVWGGCWIKIKLQRVPCSPLKSAAITSPSIPSDPRQIAYNTLLEQIKAFDRNLQNAARLLVDDDIVYESWALVLASLDTFWDSIPAKYKAGLSFKAAS